MEPAMGRPRQFDLDEALDRALHVFWTKGYEGTSVADLTEAIGINRPSLYAAFGDKASLFQKVVDRYSAGAGSYLEEAVALPSSRAVTEAVLRGAAERLTDRSHPRGCLLVSSALACGDDADPIRKALALQRKHGELALRKRFERADDLPKNVTAANLARYLFVLIQGMSVQAAGGANRKELLSVVELAMRMWR
jgi:AcrR family transcriptional regulator